MLISDRDLLTFEPDLFRDVGFLALRLVNATGSITSGKLNVSGADLAAVGVTAGHVVLHSGVPLEVTLRNSTTQLTVSLLRASAVDPIIPPPNAATAPVVVFTFAPQIAAAHAGALLMLGLPAAGKGLPGEPDETAIVNPDDLKPLVALLALSLVWSAAAAIHGAGSGAAARAEHYRLRASRERSTAIARLDVDGDWVADAERRAGAAALMRG